MPINICGCAWDLSLDFVAVHKTCHLHFSSAWDLLFNFIITVHMTCYFIHLSAWGLLFDLVTAGIFFYLVDHSSFNIFLPSIFLPKQRISFNTSFWFSRSQRWYTCFVICSSHFKRKCPRVSISFFHIGHSWSFVFGLWVFLQFRGRVFVLALNSIIDSSELSYTWFSSLILILNLL